MFSNSPDLTLIKLDTAGNILWANAYAPYNFGSNIVEHNGQIILAGKDYYPDYEYGILTLDPDGALIDDEGIGFEAQRLYIDQDNNFIGNNQSDIFKIDTGLNLLWQMDLDTISCAHSMLEGSSLFITGRYENEFEDRKDQVYLGKVNTYDGSIEWSREYGGIKDESGEGLKRALDGGFIIAGFTKSWPKSHRQGYLVKTDSIGFTSGCSDSLIFSPDSMLVCVGEQVHIQNNSIGSYASYLWLFDGDSIHSGWAPLIQSSDSIGKHSLQLVSCTDTLETLFEVKPLPDAQFEFSIYGDSVQFYSNSNDIHFWYFGDGGNSNEKNPAHIYQDTGTYYVTHSVTNLACWDGADTTLRIVVTSIEDLVQDQVSIYPVPANDVLYLYMTENIKNRLKKITIFNQIGQAVLNMQPTNKIDVTLLRPGIYFIEIKTKDKRFIEKLIII
jgi:PKD repeat protein